MILKDLPIGTKVKELKSSVIFLVADHNHTGYKGTNLVTDNAIKMASFDAAEPDNPDKAIKEFGNNFYPLSNIHQWLNSVHTNWYKPAYEFDAPPIGDNIDSGRLDFYEVSFYSEAAKFVGDFSYQKDPGFLTWFSPEFVNNLFEVDVPCYIAPKPGEHHDGPPDPYYVKAKAFIPSAPELGLEHSRAGTEGFRFPLFNDTRMKVVAPTPAAINRPSDFIYNDCSFWYWLRTPVPGSNTLALFYNSDHKIGDVNHMSTGQQQVRAISGIRPVLNIGSGVMVSSKPDSWGIYTLNLGGE